MSLFLLSMIPITIILCVGLVIIYLLDLMPKKPFLFNLGIAYGIGIGAITGQMMLYSSLHIPWKLFFLLLPWIFAGIASIFMRKLSVPKLHKSVYPFDLFYRIFFFGTLCTVLFVIFETSIHPLMAFDGWANWFLGGKAFFLHGNFNIPFVIYANNAEPPVIYLMISFVYICIGHISDHVALFLFTSFYFALLVVFYYSTKELLSKKYAIVFTFLLATLENVIRHAGRYDVGYADLTLGYYIFCSIIFLCAFIRTKIMHYLVLMNIFLITGAFIKNEGVPFFFITQGVLNFFIIKEHKFRWKYIFYNGISFFLIIMWFLYQKIFHLPETPFVRSQVTAARIPIVLISMGREFMQISRWNFLWIAYFLSFVIFFTSAPNKKYSSYGRILSLISFLQICVYFCVYLMTPLNPAMHIQNSFDRLLLHITPLAVLLIAFTTRGKIEYNKK